MRARSQVGVDVELLAPELEEMDAPDWDAVISAGLLRGAGISGGVAIN